MSRFDDQSGLATLVSLALTLMGATPGFAANPSSAGTVVPLAQQTAPQNGTFHLMTAQPLNPTELLAVHEVGAAVLGAKAHASEDPDVTAMQQELTSLRKAVDEALVLRPGTLAVAPGGVSAEPDVHANADASRRLAARSMTSGMGDNIRPVLVTLHRAALRLQARSVGPGSPTRLSRRTSLAAAAVKLEAAANDALAASGQDRYRRLLDLSWRLQVRSLSEEIAARSESTHAIGLATPAPEPTPTLATLTQHR
jgi:hypothetical protein